MGNGEVHVWRASLDLPASRVQSLQHTLAADELTRADRYYSWQDSERFIVARGLLRAILSRYLDMAPDHLRFCYGPRGKPKLDKETGGEALRFNVTHTQGLALYAVAHGREVGIDVERIRPELVDGDIAERFFSPREVAALRTLPVALRPESFFNCWTRKEAYTKARGDGLSLPLKQFDVSLAPREPAALLSTKGDPLEAARWSLWALHPGPGYVAALAVEGHDWRLECRQWVA
ncbi:4'-phosphopantetheinyl transferase family protein [Chloroflexota bacterium]